MATKMEEASGAVATARQVIADRNEAIDRLTTHQQALRQRVKDDGLKEDPSLQSQIEGTKKAIAYLNQQKVKDWFALQVAKRRAAHVESVAASVCQFLAQEGWGDLVALPGRPEPEPTLQRVWLVEESTIERVNALADGLGGAPSVIAQLLAYGLDAAEDGRLQLAVNDNGRET